MDNSISDLTDREFWTWLAGFSDGEACFSIKKGSPRSGYTADYMIVLRDDDWRVLDDIQKRCGLGYLRFRPNIRGGHTQICWQVTGLPELRKLADGFRFGSGLFGKKRRDFLIWEQAIDLILKYGGGKKSPVSEKLAELKNLLHQTKEYSPELAEGAQNCKGRLTTPRTHDAPTRLNARSAQRFWDGPKGNAERLKRSRRYRKVSQEQIDEILSKRKAGQTLQSLSNEYGISRALISRFQRGDYPKRI